MAEAAVSKRKAGAAQHAVQAFVTGPFPFEDVRLVRTAAVRPGESQCSRAGTCVPPSSLVRPVAASMLWTFLVFAIALSPPSAAPAAADGVVKVLRVQLVLASVKDDRKIPANTAELVLSHIASRVGGLVKNKVLEGDDRIILDFNVPGGSRNVLDEAIRSITSSSVGAFVKVDAYKATVENAPAGSALPGSSGEAASGPGTQGAASRPGSPSAGAMAATVRGGGAAFHPGASGPVGTGDTAAASTAREASHAATSGLRNPTRKGPHQADLTGTRGYASVTPREVHFEFETLDGGRSFRVDARDVELGLLLEAMAGAAGFQYACPFEVAHRRLTVRAGSVGRDALLGIVKNTLGLSITRFGPVYVLAPPAGRRQGG